MCLKAFYILTASAGARREVRGNKISTAIHVINKGGNRMICKKCASPGIPRPFIVFAMLAAMVCFVVATGFAGESGSTGGSFENFPYYSAKKAPDLKGKAYSFQITDKRADFAKLECKDITADNDTEFAGDVGFRYFRDYLSKMTEEASGKVTDTDSEKIKIDLEVFCPRIYGFMFVRVYGLVQFSVTADGYQKRYCFSLKDGDPDAQLGITSFSTRAGAKRTLLAATTTKALEAFLDDLEKRSTSTGTK